MKKRKFVPTSSLHDGSTPYRNIENLYGAKATIHCALSGPCVPCAFKIAAFDIALDQQFTNAVKNTRPELCPRSSNNDTYGVEGAYGFHGNMKILTIGDGDLTFSLALARLFHKANKNKEDTRKDSISIVATSYESLSTLQKIYPSIRDTISELQQYKFVQIVYEVDATNLRNTLPNEVKDKFKFHRIVWNFPCTAEKNGQDGQNNEMDQNKKLIEKFVHNCIPFMDEMVASEIQMIHKTKPPYDQWKIEQVALDGWSKDDCPLEYKGRIVFDKCLLPPYVPRKALDKKSFPCHDACLYILGWKDLSRASNHMVCDIMPTIPQHQACGENSGNDNDKKEQTLNASNQIIRVDKETIDEIRHLHLQHAKLNDGKKKKKKVNDGKKKKKKRKT